MNKIAFKNLAKEDMPLFLKWAKQPHVQNTWFLDDYEEIDNYYEKIDGNGYDYPFIIYLNENPIGYIQTSDLYAYRTKCPTPKGVFTLERPGTFCLDLFIGEEDYLNKGYGTEIVKLFVQKLLTEFNAKNILIDPAYANKRAIRCYEKVGFSKVRKEHNGTEESCIMEFNIISIYGASGKKWLDKIPEIQTYLQKHWNLNDIIPVANMSYNYVATAIKDNIEPVVLKIHYDNKTYVEELDALRFFHGKGAVRLIDHWDKHKALLLEQAVPGDTLKDFYPTFTTEVMQIYITVMHELHDQQHNTYENYQHISAWLNSIDIAVHHDLLSQFVQKAIEVKNHLLKTSQRNILLHGDLHLDNIVLASNDEQTLAMNKWVSIDPKGVIGEPEFEIAAFDILTKDEMVKPNILTLFQERTYELAQLADLSHQRIIQWIFLRVVLAAAWFIEDNLDASRTIALAGKLATVI